MKFGDQVGVPQKKTLYWKKRKTPCTVDRKQKSYGVWIKVLFLGGSDASLLGKTLTHFTPSYDDLVS